MKIASFLLRCLLGCALANAVAAQADAAPYAITDLGPSAFDAFGINVNGQVTGMFDTGIYDNTSSRNIYRAFLYSDGAMIDLGTLGGSHIYSVGYGINASGQVTGSSYPGGSSFLPRAFLYSGGTMIDLGTMGESTSQGFGINDSGQVTGLVQTPGKHARAFLYSGGKMTDIGTLGGPGSIGYAINASGQITGISWTGSGSAAYSFLYSEGKMTNLGIGGSGNAISDSGQVVSNTNGHAFLYSDGVMRDLGTLGGLYSEGHGINTSGQVVGWSYPTGSTVRHAFLYSSGTMVDLNDLLPTDSGWVLMEARSINDAGQIVGRGSYNGGSRAFLLTPQPTGGITLSTTNLLLTEGGVSGTYTAALVSAPTADVVISISADQQLSVSPTQIAFTSTNWDKPQTVTVQASQDGIAEGAHTITISHAVASTDTRYNGIVVSNVAVSITDAVIPTVNVPVTPDVFWIQPNLPVTGTAAPNATVTLTVTNLSTGEVRAVSATAGADGTWSLTLANLADGNYELQPEADGITGSKVSVAIDSHAPVSTLSIASDYGPTTSGWYTGAVNIAVTATDGVGGSGVERSESTLDGGAWTVTPSDGLPVNTDGNHTVCYRSVDKAGNIEAARCVPVPIDATAPSVNPVFDSASNLLHLNVQDAISGIASIEISRDGGQTWAAQSGPAGFTRDGTYTVHYRVRDNAGTLATGQTTVTMVTIPLIAAPADQNTFEAASQNFNLGSFSDQAADNPWNVDVDWGDGSAHSLFTLTAPGALGALPHAYADNGTYTATMKVTDQAGNTGSSSFRITVANVAPTATFTATSGPLNEGDVATLSFSNPIDPSPTDTQAGFRYAFDCGDGNGYGAAGTTSSITCAALDNPNQTVKGKVIDKDGGATEYSAVIAINNMVPVLDAVTGPSSPVQRDTPATISVDFIDPGVRDTHTAMIDWDDGTVSAGTVAETNGSGSISASHSYAKPGRYIVTLTVTDKDGVSATATYSAIRVKGGPPVR